MSRKKALRIGDRVLWDNREWVLGDILRTEPTVTYQPIVKGGYSVPEAVRTPAKIIWYILQDERTGDLVRIHTRPEHVEPLKEEELF